MSSLITGATALALLGLAIVAATQARGIQTAAPVADVVDSDGSAAADAAEHAYFHRDLFGRATCRRLFNDPQRNVVRISHTCF